MKQLLWRLYLLGLALCFCGVIFLNARLYQTPDTKIEGIRPHLTFLKERLQQGSAEEMQSYFPEGYLFNYQLYGSTWIDLALQEPSLTQEALVEARWALTALESQDGTRPFEGSVNPRYGVFYLGWTNWLRGGIVALDRGCPEQQKFEEVCQALDQALQSDGPYLDAYPGQAWPCDTTVAVACLALHDALLKERFRETRERWLKQVGPDLFPHQVRPRVHPSRGTSQVMIQRFLPEIDAEFAEANYRQFRERFVTTRFGLPGTREYPLGQDGPGDVDSGPLIFGFSFSATGVVPGAARLHGDEELYRPFDQLIDTFGFPVAGRYLGGAVPVADALLLWSRTACSWTGKPIPEEAYGPVVSAGWRWGFHLFWLLILGLLSVPLILRRRV